MANHLRDDGLRSGLLDVDRAGRAGVVVDEPADEDVVDLQGSQRRGAGFPVRTQITVQRDPDGDVKVLYGGRNPQSGILKGEIRQVAFAIHKAGAAPLGTLKIDNILVRRFVDDDSRPTSTIDVEETRP